MEEGDQHPAALKARMDAMESRQDRHETKCDERQKALHAKVDHVEKNTTQTKWFVGIGVGIIITLQFLASSAPSWITALGGTPP